MANGKGDSLGWRWYLKSMWNPSSKNVDIKRISVFEPKLAAVGILVVQLHCEPWDRRREGGCLVQPCTGWGYVAKWVRSQLLNSPCMILHCAGDSHEIESPGMDWFWMPGSPSILSCHCWLLIQTITCRWLVHYAASVYKEYHLIQRNCPNWRVTRILWTRKCLLRNRWNETNNWWIGLACCLFRR